MPLSHESHHPQHPHNLECPRCGRHSIVTRGENVFQCLNCHWRRDLPDSQVGLSTTLAIVIMVLISIVIFFDEPQEPSPGRPSEERVALK